MFENENKLKKYSSKFLLSYRWSSPPKYDIEHVLPAIKPLLHKRYCRTQNSKYVKRNVKIQII